MVLTKNGTKETLSKSTVFITRSLQAYPVVCVFLWRYFFSDFRVVLYGRRRHFASDLSTLPNKKGKVICHFTLQQRLLRHVSFSAKPELSPDLIKSYETFFLF